MLLSDDTNPMAATLHARGFRHAEHSIDLNGFPVTKWNLRSMLRQRADNPHYIAGYIDALILCATRSA